jgi:hypothetical protein
MNRQVPVPFLGEGMAATPSPYPTTPMLVGLSTAIVTKKYGADAGFAASATFWSTLFSILTLSLITFVLNIA